MFSRLYSRLDQLSQLGADTQSERPSDAEIDEFLQFRGRFQISETQSVGNPISFWMSKASVFPSLHKVAIDILCVPATSAAVERVFSQAGLSASVLRSRLSDQNLESEVMVRVNRELL